jgi:hypothetical protein
MLVYKKPNSDVLPPRSDTSNQTANDALFQAVLSKCHMHLQYKYNLTYAHKNICPYLCHFS